MSNFLHLLQLYFLFLLLLVSYIGQVVLGYVIPVLVDVIVILSYVVTTCLNDYCLFIKLLCLCIRFASI